MTNSLEKATREHTKLHNRRLILQAVYDAGEISRVGIARLTQLTPTTVSSNVAELIEEGLVEERGQGPSVGGKPPTLLGLAANARQLIGLDLSGGTLRGSLINLRGEISHQQSLPLDGASGDEALAKVLELIEALRTQATSPLLGIGIGAPGIIDPQNGVVVQAVNLDWHDLELRALLGERFGLPVAIANDSHVTALAEKTFGDHKTARNLLVLKVGRGIGAGLILNGELFYGDGWGAGEIGHVVVDEHGVACRCGNRGCLETVASSQAIVARAVQMAWHGLGAAVPTLQDLLAAHAQGDPAIGAIIAEVGRSLGTATAYLVGALNIRQIVVAGSVAGFGEALLEPLRAQVARRALSTLAAQTTVSTTQMGANIVMLGAAALLLAHELGLS